MSTDPAKCSSVTESPQRPSLILSRNLVSTRRGWAPLVPRKVSSSGFMDFYLVSVTFDSQAQILQSCVVTTSFVKSA